MLIFYQELTLLKGFEILLKEKSQRLVQGRAVSAPSGMKLFENLRNRGLQMRCWSCGLLGNCFVLNKGSNDQVSKPVLDLYSSDGITYTLMTRDHIIPKSYGGSNELPNLRVGCGPCNHGRGNALDAEDIAFARSHPELFVHGRSFTLPEGVTAVDKVSGIKKPKTPQIRLTEEQKLERKKRLNAKRKANRRKRDEKKKASALPNLTSMLALSLA